MINIVNMKRLITYLKKAYTYLKKFLISIMRLLDKTKSFIYKIKSKIVSSSKAFLYIDVSKRNAVEIVFLLTIIALILVSQYYTSFEAKKWVVPLLLIWAFLALLGFFIPTTKERFVFGSPRKTTPLIPILLRLKSKGGFIAGRKINMFVKVISLQEGINSKQAFRDNYDEFSIVFFQSTRLPIKLSRFLEGQPERGGVIIDIKKCQGKASIFFSSPGPYNPKIIYKLKNNPKPLIEDLKLDIDPLITISPPEIYVSLRNYAITYSLTLVILLLAILQLKLI